MKSKTHWFVQKKYKVGEGEIRAKVYAEILDYKELPSFFDIEGKARGYSVSVALSYTINCSEKTFQGKRFFDESFPARNPYDYKISTERARKTLLKKIEDFLIAESLRRCADERR